MRPLSWVIAPFVLFAASGIFPRPLHAQCPLLYTFDGSVPNERLGLALKGVGDVDGDGCDDVLVGAPGHVLPNGERRGAARLHSGATGGVLRTWYGDFMWGGGGGFGSPVGAAGDVDADGVPDVIISAPGFPSAGINGAGRVYVYSGASGALLWSWDGDRVDDWFGYSVAGPGDVDNDGHADIAIGQPGFRSPFITFPGRVYLYSGATGRLLWARDGDAAADHLGWAMDGAGDFDGDQCPDLVVGTWDDPGYVYVLSGCTGESVCRVWSPEADSSFAQAVAGVGDVDANGFADVIVGAYRAGGEHWYSDNGQAYVFGGPDGRLLWTWEGESFTDFFGYSVDGAGDLDGDLVPDVVIGAYGHFGAPGYLSGKAYAFSGAHGSQIWCRDGESSGDAFGIAVAGAGDVDGDGRAELAIGADWHDAGLTLWNSGRAYIFTPSLTGGCDQCYGPIDLYDYWQFWNCFSARVTGVPDVCHCGDFDLDGKLDLLDYAAMQRRFGERR